MGRLLALMLIALLLIANAAYFAWHRGDPPDPMADPGRAPPAAGAEHEEPPAAPAPSGTLSGQPTVPGSAPGAPPERGVTPAPVTPAAAVPAGVAAAPGVNRADAKRVDGATLLIPVAGVSAAQLVDTYTDARSEGRVHDAIDIMAAGGTPVLAAADGRIEKLFTSVRGGITVYQFADAGDQGYYYAHLKAYAAGLAEQQRVRRGDVIGYVGSTGNADPAGPHLHFEVFVMGPERQWWKTTPLNPYPLLGGH